MIKTERNNYCNIYLVRHGETVWNVERLMQGQKDSPLTAKGEEQAKELAALFSAIHFDEFYSSDVGRAMRTAEFIALEHQAAVKTTALLRERTMGVYEGVKVETYLKELGGAIREMESLSEAEQLKYKLAPDMESDEEIISRFITFLREVAVSHPNQTILAVTHSGMMRSLLMHLGFGDRQETSHEFLEIANLSYIKLETDGVDFFIRETKGVIRLKTKSHA